MIKKFCFVAVLLITAVTGKAQEGSTTSPYSFFGVGLQQFRGTVESRAMGGIQLQRDSIHLNLLNPGSLSDIKFTTFTVGANHQEVISKTETQDESTSKTTFDYFALGFPVSKKAGVAFGLMPFTSVGYQISETNEEATIVNRFTGRGGLNRAFVSAGYEIIDGLNVGFSANYNFGNIQTVSLRAQEDVELGTEERNRKDISGLGFELSAQYERMITDKLKLNTYFKYVPESTSYNSINEREISSVQFTNTGVSVDFETIEIDLSDTNFDYPASFTVGLGLGEKNKWFVGADLTNEKTIRFANVSPDITNATFKNATYFRIGGFYVPKYNSISSYWERITYRAGFRLEETGLNISGEDIEEFGISFGVGLPAGRKISNINITTEYGQRGTTNANLVQENFFNVGVSLSINDLWFVKSKFN